MTRTPHRVHRYLRMASLCLLGCSGTDLEVDLAEEDGSFGLQWVVLEPGETQKESNCAAIGATGIYGTGDSTAALDPSNYRLQTGFGSGKAFFRFFVQSYPGSELKERQGELALEIRIDSGNFGEGSARLATFQTPDGVVHRVYLWGTGDCNDADRGPPPWVAQHVEPG